MYLFHWIEDQLQAMASAKWFTTLDLTKKYHQIKIAEEIQGDHCVFNTQKTVSMESLANEDEDIGSGVLETSQFDCRGITATLCGSIY